MSNKKIALITGGSRGLGKNTAIAFAKKGVDVIITYKSKKEEAEEVVRQIRKNGIKASALQLDVSNHNDFPAFLDKLNQLLNDEYNKNTIDYLVNNAGFGVNTPFAKTSVANFDQLVNVHFKGVFFFTQTLLDTIADNGAIINFSTGLTRFCLPGYSAYAAMKGAIEILSKYMAKELGNRGIRVNVVAPGAVDTDFNKAALEAHPEMRGFIASQTTLGRMGEANDIGGVVVALCSDELGWVNAQRVEVSGGMFL